MFVQRGLFDVHMMFDQRGLFDVNNMLINCLEDVHEMLIISLPEVF
jgi:hypothetical protein